MRWLHAGVCRDILHAIIEELSATGEQAPDPLIVACPRCEDQFFADFTPYDELLALEEIERATLQRLEHECPGHAHRFEVRV
jgi:hypothetical protein